MLVLVVDRGVPLPKGGTRLTWEPWYSWALLIFAGIVVFIALEWRK